MGRVVYFGKKKLLYVWKKKIQELTYFFYENEISML